MPPSVAGACCFVNELSRASDTLRQLSLWWWESWSRRPIIIHFYIFFLFMSFLLDLGHIATGWVGLDFVEAHTSETPSVQSTTDWKLSLPSAFFLICKTIKATARLAWAWTPLNWFSGLICRLCNFPAKEHHHTSCKPQLIHQSEARGSSTRRSSNRRGTSCRSPCWAKFFWLICSISKTDSVDFATNGGDTIPTLPRTPASNQAWDSRVFKWLQLQQLKLRLRLWWWVWFCKRVSVSTAKQCTVHFLTSTSPTKLTISALHPRWGTQAQDSMIQILLVRSRWQIQRSRRGL